ncbi:hypothetical protein Neosp_007582 [[Neocosmospora] mangrovei]
MSSNGFFITQPLATHSSANGQAEGHDDSGAVLDATTGLVLPSDVKVAYEVIANNTVSAPSQQDSVEATAAILGLETQASTFLDFALELVPASALKSKLVAFLDAPYAATDQSLVPIDAFLSRPDRSDWDTHCVTMKDAWQLFCAKVESLSDGQIDMRQMAAPSGPARSKVAMLWHYPTFTSGNSVFSHVMDPDSPSLWVQLKKMGLDSGIKTLDLFPFRLEYDHDNGPQWETRFSNWPALREACLELTKELVSDDRLLVVTGDEIWQEAKWLVTSRGLSLTYLELQVDLKMFGTKPRIYLAQDSDKKIQQVIIRIWHGQYIYHNSNEPRGAMWDLMWNVACNIADVEIKSPVLLTWAATHFLRSTSQDPSVALSRPGSYTVLQTLMRRQEKEKKPVTLDEVHQYFPNLFLRHPELVDALKRQEEGAIPPPPPKRVATDAKKIDAAEQSALVRKSDQQRKWEALQNCHQVRQAEANRQNPEKTMGHTRTLERMDRMKAMLEAGESKKFSAELAGWAIFYNAKKFPRGLPYRPEHGIDTYIDEDHPAVLISRQTRVRDPIERRVLAGPVEE